MERKSGDEGYQSFGCHRCDTLFTERPAMLRHLLFQCNQKSDLVCSRCDTVFATEEDFEEHKTLCFDYLEPFAKRHKKKDSLDVEGCTVICVKCGKMFKDRNSYAQHEKKCDATSQVKKAKLNPEEDKEEYLSRQFDLKPKKVPAEELQRVEMPRPMRGRIRKTPVRFADEAYEKGWAETTVGNLAPKKIESPQKVVTLPLQPAITTAADTATVAAPEPPAKEMVPMQIIQAPAPKAAAPVQFIQLPGGQIVQAITVPQQPVLAQQPMKIILQPAPGQTEVVLDPQQFVMSQEVIKVGDGTEETATVTVEQLEAMAQSETSAEDPSALVGTIVTTSE